MERKNKVVQEMARVMLHNKKLPKSFCGEAVNTACHTLNRVYFRIFGSDCYILRDRENLEKFDAKSDKIFFRVLLY